MQLANFASPYAGSFVPIQLGLLDAARERGWTAEIAFPPAAAERPWLEEFDAAGIPWRIAPEGSRRALGRWIGAMLDERPGPAVLHTHFTLFDVPAAMALHGRPNARLIWHMHTPLLASAAARLRNRLKLAAYARRVSAIACVAPDLREEWIRRGAPPEKIHLVPNAIDTDRFPLLSRDERARARRDLGLPADAPVLLHLGWDWRRKGGDLFLRAVSALRGERFPSLVGVTVGGEGDAKRPRAPEGVIELPPTRDVRSLYAAADVFCSPSRAEGQPYAMMEALSCGTSVAASDIPGQMLVAEAVPGCQTFRSEDPGGLADAVRALLAREAAAVEADAAASHSAMAEHFGIEPWSRRLLDCYERLIAEIPG